LHTNAQAEKREDGETPNLHTNPQAETREDGETPNLHTNAQAERREDGETPNLHTNPQAERREDGETPNLHTIPHAEKREDGKRMAGRRVYIVLDRLPWMGPASGEKTRWRNSKLGETALDGARKRREEKMPKLKT
jgi:hypothetical protein